MKKNSIKIPNLQATTEYANFKKINSNRDINKSHLNKLIQGIQAKNLLYLFPIVVNKDMEIVDGQHRLKAAEALMVPVYYLVDNNITKADIAMVNSNRKAWGVQDYVGFYADEGDQVFKDFRKIKSQYPKLTWMTIARLIDTNATNYMMGGGMFSRNIKIGKLDGGNLALAHVVCNLAQRLHTKSISYAFNPFFILDLKNSIIQSGHFSQDAADIIYKKANFLPSFSDTPIPQYLSTLKDILGIQSKRPLSTKEEVAAFLERESQRKK